MGREELMRILLCGALALTPIISAPLAAQAIAADMPVAGGDEHPQSKNYNPEADATAQVDAALARAATNGHHVIIAMGANWCHDSIGFAGWFDTPRFRKLAADKFEIVYVDVGRPQIGAGRNLHIAKRFRAKKIKATPTILILSPQGKLLNRKDAGAWRNAANRSEDEIYDYFAAL